MADETQMQFEALLKQGDRTLGAIESLGNEIRSLAQGIVKGFANMQGVNTNHSNGNSWQLLVAVASIMFGLLTPVYFMVQAQGDSITAINGSMRDDNKRERTDAAAIAKLSESMREVETQFKSVRDIMDERDKNQSEAMVHMREHLKEIKEQRK